MDTAELIREAEAKLAILDPVLGALIITQDPMAYVPRSDYFYSLSRAIVGQQVSVVSASAIFGRLESETGLDPAAVAELSPDQIKAIGLSRQKATYLSDLAGHFIDNPGVYNHLDIQSDEQVLAELTAVKGIGLWTAQMFLMFTLARLDVFAADDVGLQKAIKALYKLDAKAPKSELEQIADMWRPYRTVASWHLWQSLRNTPTD